MTEAPWLDLEGMLIRLAIGQCVVFMALGWLIVGGMRLRRQIRETRPSAEALADVLRPAVEVFAGELRGEVAALRRASEALDRRAERTAPGRRNGKARTETPSDEAAQGAREQARRLLTEGLEPAVVARQTGLPAGELSVLAGILAQQA